MCSLNYKCASIYLRYKVIVPNITCRDCKYHAFSVASVMTKLEQASSLGSIASGGIDCRALSFTSWPCFLADVYLYCAQHPLGTRHCSCLSCPVTRGIVGGRRQSGRGGGGRRHGQRLTFPRRGARVRIVVLLGSLLLLAAIVATTAATDALPAMVADRADEPGRAAAALPGPVLLEVVLARLDTTAADEDDQADETVQDCVYEEAAGRQFC